MKKNYLHFSQIIKKSFFFFGFLIVLVSCSNDDNMDGLEPQSSIQEILMRNSFTSKSVNSPGKDPIAAIAIGGGFSELVEALQYVDKERNAGLVNLFLNGKDQYTVFAPTNDAFNNLYKALNVDDITDLDPDLVLAVLKYHVTTGRRASNSVVPKNGMRTIETLLGTSFWVTPTLQINAIGNTANILVPNISASNGIIHVIDAVILPIKV